MADEKKDGALDKAAREIVDLKNQLKAQRGLVTKAKNALKVSEDKIKRITAPPKEPKTLDLKEATKEPREPWESKLFNFGILRTCPMGPLYLGGMAFSKVTEIVRSEAGETKRKELKGVTARLTRKQLIAIYAAGKAKYIRTVGRRKHHVTCVVDSRQKHFVPVKGDKCVLDYIYFEAIEEKQSPHSKAESPSASSMEEALVG